MSLDVVIFKSKADKQAHILNVIGSWYAVAKPGDRLYRKDIGQLSRRVTEQMGIPNATIPGQETVDTMILFTKLTGITKPNYTPKKVGKKIRRYNAYITKK